MRVHARARARACKPAVFSTFTTGTFLTSTVGRARERESVQERAGPAPLGHFYESERKRNGRATRSTRSAVAAATRNLPGWDSLFFFPLQRYPRLRIRDFSHRAIAALRSCATHTHFHDLRGVPPFLHLPRTAQRRLIALLLALFIGGRKRRPGIPRVGERVAIEARLHFVARALVRIITLMKPAGRNSHRFNFLLSF